MYGFYKPNNIGSRNCCRCHLPLTDAASLNEGIGPICRKLDNALLARLIPSNLEAALAAYKSVDVLALVSDTMPTFMDLEAALIDPNASTREDWRKEVKRVEWILSFGQTYQNVKALKAMVLALGYVGIVSLWNGEAATGLATVWFDGEKGRLCVRGPQNKAARIALKKILGWVFHPVKAADEKPHWSVPAERESQFFTAVATHYPNFEGLNESIKLAKSYNETQAALKASAEKLAKIITLDPVTPPPEPTVTLWSPGVSLEEEGSVLKVKTPYHVCFIATLKGLPYAVRKWNPTEKVWEVQATYRSQVEEMLNKFFPQSA